ncbi:MAG: hypothetical protein U5L01_04635 [Rheinheimera sp.]|nr:hypothetical protein [Rheinheimera sp.]
MLNISLVYGLLGSLLLLVALLTARDQSNPRRFSFVAFGYHGLGAF